MKSFRHSEAALLGVAPSTIASRIARGLYRLELNRRNRRVVYVTKAERVKFETVNLQSTS